jgi:hypothetical protein
MKHCRVAKEDEISQQENTKLCGDLLMSIVIDRIHALCNERIGVMTCPVTGKRRLNLMHIRSRIARRKSLISKDNRLKRERW